MDRRGFLKALGAAAVAGAAGKAVTALAASRKAHGGAEFRRQPELRRPSAAAGWAMVVDLSKCMRKDGCRDCVTACHAEHNVPDFGNRKDEIKWIWKEPFESSFHGQVHELMEEKLGHAELPLLCNHCENPPCVKVCPTKATWKRKDGIVMMDWHRCIGCRYCMAACPYGSRSFNWRDPRQFIRKERLEFPTRTKGVVEKCTFCEERLAKGKLPACVEACRAKALVFGRLDDPKSAVRKLLGSRFSLTRKPALGTGPKVFYLV